MHILIEPPGLLTRTTGELPNDQTETLADLVFDQSLNQKQRNQLKDLCASFDHVFTTKPGKPSLLYDDTSSED
jgi:hypothetical protein